MLRSACEQFADKKVGDIQDIARLTSLSNITRDCKGCQLPNEVTPLIKERPPIKKPTHCPNKGGGVALPKLFWTIFIGVNFEHKFMLIWVFSGHPVDWWPRNRWQYNLLILLLRTWTWMAAFSFQIDYAFGSLTAWAIGNAQKNERSFYERPSLRLRPLHWSSFYIYILYSAIKTIETYSLVIWNREVVFYISWGDCQALVFGALS